SSILGGAEIVITPEKDITMADVEKALEDAYVRGKSHAIAVIAEGAKYSAADLQNHLSKNPNIGFEIRLTILGHTQRGGSPSAFDRLLATRMGVTSVRFLTEGKTGVMTALQGRQIIALPLEDAISQLRPISEGYFEMARFLSR
ncbi:MAG: 6-phosphofructokinase, partial [Chloroflexota bacterium]|nr:6-phosphofructokinase [Chloroflexota bacterium]